MTVNRWSCIIALLTLCGVATLASAQSAGPDGLVKVSPRRMEMAWLRPGADFRPYTKVIIGKTQVAFLPNWLKDYNLNADLGSKITKEKADQIMAAAQTNLDGILSDAFRKAGYEVVTTPGPDTLLIVSGLLDLDVNAPAGMDGYQTSYIVTAGQAALIVEVRDSATKVLLGRVADRRETQDMGRQMASDATNLYDFRQLFALWARICTTALGEVKAVSPIPKDLQPNQKL